MINKLRNKIVLTNLVLVGILLLIVSIVVCIVIANDSISRENRRLDLAMNYVLEMPGKDFTRYFGFIGSYQEDASIPRRPDGTRPPLPDDGGRQSEAAVLPETIDGAVFAVLIDGSGSVVSKHEFFASMDEEALAFALDKVEQSGKTSGTIPDLELSFAKRDTKNGTAVAFTSRSDTVATIRNSILIALCIDTVIMIFIAFISFRLASLSVKPVREAWDTQKRFIADASHELKTPLTVILANNSILEASVSEPENRQWLESSRYEAERMHKLIEEMLFLAKSDEGGYKLSLGEVNLSEVAERCCLSFETVAFDQNVFIDSAVEPDVNVTTDASMAERVFGVLLDNAVKHSPEGGTVRFSMTEDAKSVTVTVSNEGDPIPEDDMSHIFERFYKSDASRTSDSAKSGFGLGLAIAHDIVEKLGGSIGVKSSEADGTVFTVVLKKNE